MQQRAGSRNRLNGRLCSRYSCSFGRGKKQGPGQAGKCGALAPPKPKVWLVFASSRTGVCSSPLKLRPIFTCAGSTPRDNARLRGPHGHNVYDVNEGLYRRVHEQQQDYPRTAYLSSDWATECYAGRSNLSSPASSAIFKSQSPEPG
jgi:hypothetical protein